MNALEYISAIFGDALKDHGGGIEVRAINPTDGQCHALFYRTIEELVSNSGHLKSLNQQGFNLYLGMNPRPAEGKGKKEDIKIMTCLWLDVDYGTDTRRHKKQSVHKTREEAKAAIERLPLKPSILVHSGSGFYAIWLLKEPEEVTPETRMQAESAMRGLGAMCGGDSTHNIDRILKLPGTDCMKIPTDPRPCTIIEGDADRRYNLSDFDEWAEAAYEKVDGPGIIIDQIPNDLPEAFRKLLENDERCRDLWEGQGKSEGDTSQSGYDESVLCYCLRKGISGPVDLAAILQARIKARGDERKKSRGKKYIERTVRQAMQAMARDSSELAEPGGQGESEAGPTIKSIIPDAPIDERAVVPLNWVLTEKCVAQFSGHNKAPKPVIPTLLLIIGILYDVSTGNALVRLAWRRHGRWTQEVVGREVIASNQRIIPLAGRGLAVTSANALAVVKYLADFEAVNQEILPQTKITTHMGWQGKDGTQGFMLGRNHHTSQTDPGEKIIFQGADSGDDQLAETFKQDGTLDNWLNMVHKIAHLPRVMAAIYASLTAPLLEVIKVPSFTISWDYLTSCGKTTILRLAASIWGNPENIGNWDSTRVWRERRCATLHSLPFIIDDTKQAKKNSDVTQAIYDLSSGAGKGRGSIDGTKQTGHWRLPMLTTGEQPMTSFTTDGGSKTRVLVLWGPPFEAMNDATRQLVGMVNETVRFNYGHVGPIFIEYLIQNRDSWGALRDAHKAAVKYYSQSKEAAGNPFAGRIAEYMAVLNVASTIFHEKYPELPKVSPDTLWAGMVNEVSEADRAKEALKVVWDWAVANQNRFFGREKKRQDLLGEASDQPNAGWAGRWASNDEWGFIGFIPGVLNDILTKAGFSGDAVRLWKDMGYLDTDEGRSTKKVRVNRELTNLVAIKKTAFDIPSGGEREHGNTSGNIKMYNKSNNNK